MQVESARKQVGVKNFLAIAGFVVVILLLVLAVPSAQAQSYTVVHNFANGLDGYSPETGLIVDRAGNYYGASSTGGTGRGGVVFKLTHSGSGWIFTPLHEFTFQEGSGPNGLTFGPDGNLYGTAGAGGAGGVCNGSGCGTVFRLSPPVSNCRTSYCLWNATVLYRFSGNSDGGNPLGGIVFDQAGNLYGATNRGGNLSACPNTGCGVVFKLTPSPHGGWAESVIHRFSAGNDGSSPYSGLIIDSVGNLYGTTASGGTSGCTVGCGTVYELTPTGQGWTETILYNFPNEQEGAVPYGGLVLDSAGDLYGTTVRGGSPGCQCGTIFSLSPSNGGWTYTILYGFTAMYADKYPHASLFRDSSGDLYGTTVGGDNLQAWGNVFELSPSNGSWIYTSLYSFTGGTDGGAPVSNVVQDADGNLYGTASWGGGNGGGVIWEVTP